MAANLGEATTTELLEELNARAQASTVNGEDWPNYRTVGDYHAEKYAPAWGQGHARRVRENGKRFEFSEPYPTLKQAIAEAIGAGSVCFEDGTVPTGIFDTEFALSIVDALHKLVQEYARVKVSLSQPVTVAPQSPKVSFDMGLMWHSNRSAAYDMGVEVPTPPRFTAELVPQSYNVFVNGLHLGTVQRYSNSDQWFFSTLNRHSRAGLRDVIANKINLSVPPGADKIEGISGDLHVKLTDPEFFVPQKGTDDDDEEDPGF